MRFVVGMSLFVGAFVAAGPLAASENGDSLELFEKRILPIFQASRPSSCTECHLSGVELKNYIRPTEAETWASLISAKLVDPKSPDDSKILEFISRRPEKPNLISDAVRQQEYDAFRNWIRAAAGNAELLKARDSASVGPTVPVEVIRHARKDRVLGSFIDNVWNEVGRCAACHSPDRNQKQVKEHGEQVSWITLNDPVATMNYMLDADLIDVKKPENSLLLRKPTQQVEHGGGQKMLVGDRTYKQFRRFIDDYSNVVHGRYDSADQLPAPGSEAAKLTEIWLKLTDVPAKYDQMLLQVDLHRWDGSNWSENRVATSDRAVFGGGQLWQHSLGLVAPRDSQWAKDLTRGRLPAGRYLIKVYIDQKNKLSIDFQASLGPSDLVREIEVESRWPAGYGRMTIVSFK